jgi:hypothetical protein
MILEITISLLAVAGFGLVLWWVRIVLVARDAMKATMAGLSAYKMVKWQWALSLKGSIRALTPHEKIKSNANS